MKVEFLGTRGNIEPSAQLYSKHSGVLVDDKILFDLGEKEFLDRKPECIFLTHLHWDHAFFMTQRIGDLGVPIFAPETSHRLPELKKITGKIASGPYQISPFPTQHSQKVKSIAYLVEDGSNRILYTGDLIGIDSEYLRLMGNLGLVITDGSFMRIGGLIRRDSSSNPYGHNGVPDLVELFTGITDRIVFTHFGSWFYRDIERSKKEIKALGDDVKVEAAYDGLVIDL